jgi:Fic family protein
MERPKRTVIIRTPVLDERELNVLEEIGALRKRLERQLHAPRRWYGSIRRVTMARAIQGSNSIEGFNAPLDDAAAVQLGEEPLDANQETRLALKGYRDAMTYVLQLLDDQAFMYSEQLLKALHYMMTNYDLKNRPGQWRVGAIYVKNEETGKTVYEGADIDLVPELVQNLVDSLNASTKVPALVRAAMAHLNLVMIHPFKDGNGRMSRCLQTLVIARDGTPNPEFCSIEEYLGSHTPAYYEVLNRVGGARWNAEVDARPWIRFVLTAHLMQERLLLRRIKETERLWADLETLAKDKGLLDRTVLAMYDAAIGWRVRNSTYRAAAIDEMSERVASRDLKQLVEAGLLEPQGEKRHRFYVGTPVLRAMRQAIIDARDPVDESDPFATDPIRQVDSSTYLVRVGSAAKS